MTEFMQNYFNPRLLHAIYIPELSHKGDSFYRMLSEFAAGSVRRICFNDSFMILIAAFTPVKTFEKMTEIYDDYIEISQFETDSSSWKIGGHENNY